MKKFFKKVGHVLAAPFVFIWDTITFLQILWDESKNEEVDH